jgi:hypothetical protein
MTAAEPVLVQYYPYLLMVDFSAAQTLPSAVYLGKRRVPSFAYERIRQLRMCSKTELNKL